MTRSNVLLSVTSCVFCILSLMKKRLTYFIVLKIIDYSLYCKNFHVTNYLIERMFVWSLGMWLFYLPNVSYVDRSYKSTQKVLRKTRQHQKIHFISVCHLQHFNKHTHHLFFHSVQRLRQMIKPVEVPSHLPQKPGGPVFL